MRLELISFQRSSLNQYQVLSFSKVNHLVLTRLSDQQVLEMFLQREDLGNERGLKRWSLRLHIQLFSRGLKKFVLNQYTMVSHQDLNLTEKSSSILTITPKPNLISTWYSMISQWSSMKPECSWKNKKIGVKKRREYQRWQRERRKNTLIERRRLRSLWLGSKRE